MMLKLKAALIAPYPYWPLIVVVGVGPTILVAGVSRDFVALAAVATVLLKIFIFGKILSLVLPDRVSTFGGILREYGACYFVAGILVGVFAFALLAVISSVTSPQLAYRWFGWAVRGLVAAFTIYVWPLVFLNRSSFASILAGVTVLMRNLLSSLWIVGIVLIGQAVLTVGQLVYLDQRSGWSFGVMLLAGLVYIYLAAVSFAAALYNLLGVRVVESTAEA
jgi:hypothetical protein